VLSNHTYLKTRVPLLCFAWASSPVKGPLSDPWTHPPVGASRTEKRNPTNFGSESAPGRLTLAPIRILHPPRRPPPRDQEQHEPRPIHRREAEPVRGDPARGPQADCRDHEGDFLDERGQHQRPVAHRIAADDQERHLPREADADERVVELRPVDRRRIAL